MAKTDKAVTGDRVITPKGRLSFASIFEPDTKGKYPTGQYKATILFYPKTDKEAMVGLNAMKAAALKVAQEAFGKETKLSDIQHPFNQGNKKAEKYEAYTDAIFVTAKSKYRPGVVDAKKAEILDPQDLYSGCWVRASLVPYSYDGKEKGVTFRLCNIQKLADDKRFGGGSRAEDDFDAVESGSQASEEEPFEDEDDGLGFGGK